MTCSQKKTSKVVAVLRANPNPLRVAQAARVPQAATNWALGCDRRTIWIVDGHRDDGRRFVVRADEILTAFLELESAIRRRNGITRPRTVGNECVSCWSTIATGVEPESGETSVMDWALV